DAYDNRKRELTNAIQSIGASRYGIDVESSKLIEELTLAVETGGTAKQRTALIEALEKRGRAPEGGFDFPFAFSEAEWVRCQGPDLENRGRKSREAADRVFKSNCFVPPGAAYDADRADLYVAAARLAELASHVEIGPFGSWGNAYNPHAAYAVRLLDAVQERG